MCAKLSYSHDMSNDFTRITTNNDYPINRMYLDGNFSPIGWSKDGFFAYAEYAKETTNDYGAIISNKSAVYIMNTITDKIVGEISNYTERVGKSLTYTDEYLKDVSFEKFWREEQSHITSLLREYNIVSFPDMELQEIDTLMDLFGVDIYLVKTAWQNNPNINIWVHSNYKWNICAARNGKTKILGSTGSAWSLDEICGYYKSPFENRIVVYVKESFDEENSIGMLQPGLNLYKFIGCHLTIGF